MNDEPSHGTAKRFCDAQLHQAAGLASALFCNTFSACIPVYPSPQWANGPPLQRGGGGGSGGVQADVGSLCNRRTCAWMRWVRSEGCWHRVCECCAQKKTAKLHIVLRLTKHSLHLHIHLLPKCQYLKAAIPWSSTRSRELPFLRPLHAYLPPACKVSPRLIVSHAGCSATSAPAPTSSANSSTSSARS